MNNEDVVYTTEYYSIIKKNKNLAICKNMGGPGGYYAKGNKSDREREKLVTITKKKTNSQMQRTN